MAKGGRSKKAEVPELPALGEALELMRVLWSVANALETRSLAMKRELGVSGPQRLVIRLVGRFPGITPTALAEMLCVHPSTLSTQLKRLEKRKLIARRFDVTDRRRAFLCLTRAGEALNVPSPNTVEAGIESLLATSAAREIAQTKRFLSRLADTIRAR